MLQRLRRVPLETYITVAVVGAAGLFVLLQLSPSLLIKNTTPAGGDTGAHVWSPDYLANHLLPQGRVTGWAPAWYAGFPALFFYFPLPSLLIAALAVVLPYGVAFKLVTVLGLLSLPVAACIFGRLINMRFPGPAILAVATVPFLFDRGFNIYGGNIASTLAGEFSFSISLSLALLFLGVVARSLETGRHRALAAVLLALTGLSHLLPTLFAVVGAVVLLLLRPGRARLRLLVTVLGVGALLAAFWSLPFLFRMPYTNNMGWGKIHEYRDSLFPPSLTWLAILAGIGAGATVIRALVAGRVTDRTRVGLFLIGLGVIAGATFVVAPEGRLWNARALPFWFLCLYLLAGVAVYEIGALLANFVSADANAPSRPVLLAAPAATALAVLLFVGAPLQILPKQLPDLVETLVDPLGVGPAPLYERAARSWETADVSYIPSWAKWNYSGYEEKPAYPEYRGVIDTMAEVGRTEGCGRAHWEYDSSLDRFGTPMALMLLPYWTDQCIQSMEGLYFESSATTPFHFLNAGELSKAPSNPQRDLPYEGLDLKEGIEQLQIMGARYYMAFSPEAVSAAASNPALTEIASSGQWRVYKVAGSELVTSLANEPVVVTGIDRGSRSWLDVSVDWYTENDLHDVYWAASGPENWARISVYDVETDSKTRGAAVREDPAPKRPLPPVAVTNIKAGDDTISFDVDRPGTPVLVKASYFPNWKTSGAEGPFRVTPNLMVVVPTQSHVELRYGWTPVDVAGWLLTLVGAVLAVALAVRRPVDLGDPEPPAAPVVEHEQLTLEMALSR